jgi:tRNA(Arg) A34 adenosine deaminase TadA
MRDGARRESIRRSDQMTDAFMARAIDLALENVKSGKGGPFAAVVVKDGRIVGEGANSVTEANDPTAHGEIMAIRDACKNLQSFDLTDCEIYTSCEPCPMCLVAIYWARLDRIHYGAWAADAAEAGFDDAFFYEELRKPADARRIPMTSVMREQGRAPFRAWIEKSDKIPY